MKCMLCGRVRQSYKTITESFEMQLREIFWAGLLCGSLVGLFVGVVLTGAAM